MFDLVQERDTSRSMGSRTVIYLIMHGEASLNETEALTEIGRNQVTELARSRIAVGVSKIYTSKTKETKQTSAILAREFECQISNSDCLVDVRIGKKGMDEEILRDTLQKLWVDPDYTPRHSESLFEARFRFGECIDKISSKHRNEAIGIVTHPFVASVFLTLIFGGNPKISDWLNFGFASCTTIEYSGKKWELVMPPEDSFLSNPVSVRDALSTELRNQAEKLESEM